MEQLTAHRTLSYIIVSGSSPSQPLNYFPCVASHYETGYMPLLDNRKSMFCSQARMYGCLARHHIGHARCIAHQLPAHNATGTLQ